MQTRRIVIGTLAAVGMLALYSTVEASYPWYGHQPFSTYTQDYIPYFAKHPPVYYSYPVGRPYGFGPYAYPPGVPTPGPTRPLVVKNSYVVQDTSMTSRRQPEPLRIINPFIDREIVPGQPEDSDLPELPDFPSDGPAT